MKTTETVFTNLLGFIAALGVASTNHRSSSGDLLESRLEQEVKIEALEAINIFY